MHCFPCFTCPKNKKSSSTEVNNVNETRPPEKRQQDETEQTEETTLKTFTFRELATATKNFRQECLLGEGGFGRVYKGTLKNNNGQVVAVKQLDKHGLHESKEFQAEVLALGRIDHQNLIKLIGYCAEGDQRLLVYDYISGGSLQDHLHEAKGEAMDWKKRMQIAYDIAQGVDYLHEKANPPLIYRDLKASNILLDDEFSPKLSDFGLHKLGPETGDNKMMGLSSRVMGTYGYSAPEYTRDGILSMKSDVYSFGVVLLELITGRRALDTTKPNDEQNLVSWAQPIFKDPKRYPDMADPVLEKRFSERGLNQVVAIASMCVQEEASARPLISDVMVALSFISMSTEDGIIPTAVPIESFRDKSMSIALSRADSRFVSPEPTTEDEKSCTSSDEEECSSDNENEEVDMNMKKKHEEEEGDSSRESDDGSDSNSDDGHVNVQDSLPPKPIDDDILAAQSLKIDYRYSWEKDERLSSKSSHNSNEESTSSRYDIDKDHDVSHMKEDKEKEEKDEEEEEEDITHIPSSESDDDEDDGQSVYFDNDDDDDDDLRDDNTNSMHQMKPDGMSDSFKDKNGEIVGEIK